MYLRLSNLINSKNDSGNLVDNKNGNLYVALVKARIPFLFYNVTKENFVKRKKDGAVFKVTKGSYEVNDLSKVSGKMLKYDTVRKTFNLHEFDWDKAEELHEMLGSGGVIDFMGSKSKFSFHLGELDSRENWVDYRSIQELYCYNVDKDVRFGKVLDVEPRHLVYKKLRKGLFRFLNFSVLDGHGNLVETKHPIEIEVHLKEM